MDRDPRLDTCPRVMRRRRVLFRPLCMAIAVTTFLSGCGGSGEPVPTTAERAHPITHPPSRTASSPAGSARANGHSGSTPRSDSPSVSRQVFASKANAACRAVRDATPASGPGAQAQSRGGFDEAAALGQMINVLLRLRPPPPPSLRPQVAHLLSSLDRLRQLDAAPTAERRHTGAPSDLPPGVSQAEQRAAGEALAAGMPDCSPVQLGYPNGSPPR